GLGARGGGGRVVIGVSGVRAQLQRDALSCVVLAADASPRTREKVERLARARRVPVLMGPVAERLGAGLGRPPVQAVGVAVAAAPEARPKRRRRTAAEMAAVEAEAQAEAAIEAERELKAREALEAAKAVDEEEKPSLEERAAALFKELPVVEEAGPESANA